MRGAITILEPPGEHFAEVHQAFRAHAGRDWDVQLVFSEDEVADAIADPARHHLAIVPETWSATPPKRNADRATSGSDASGLDVVRRLCARAAGLPIVVMAESGSVDSAARAIAAGATEYLVRGEHLGERIGTLLGKLRALFDAIDRNRALDDENVSLRRAIQARFEIVGQSPAIRQLMERIRRVADIPRPVLIVGQRGTGKELVARAIHFAAGRRTRDPAARPIVTVNCAAFHDALLESELFGHEKGAFTGADATRRGKFEQADGGTLFLDEIGHMSLPFQQKILRVVEYGTLTRVGGTLEQKTTARIIAATNCDLAQRIRDGEFLADLYDRLAFEVIEAPSLVQRTGDVALLANHFLNQFALETPAFGGKTLSKAAIAALEAYPFPGNVRELKNIIERAAYRDEEGEITPADLGLPTIKSSDASAIGGGAFHDRLDDYARRMLEDAMRQADGNQAQAARLLGLSYHRFRYFYKKHVTHAVNGGGSRANRS